MSHKRQRLDRRIFATALVSILIISYAIAYASSLPPRQANIFQLYVLGNNGTLSNYFPSGVSVVAQNLRVNWSLVVINNMGTSQYVTIEVKLGNETTSGPNVATYTPSTLSPLVQFSQVLSSNSTWKLPFDWLIQDVSTLGATKSISVIINGNGAGSGNITATNGVNFRFIFELWTIDPSSGNQIFGWKNPSGQDVAWTQLWFNVTST